MRRGMESDEREREKWRQWRVFAFGIERVVFGLREFFFSALSVERGRGIYGFAFYFGFWTEGTIGSF